MGKEKLELYNRLRFVPESAKKTIGAGRLKGFTDINPMYRIKALTEEFGAYGIGWYIEVTKETEKSFGGGEVVKEVEVNLYYKIGDEWSKPAPGKGGSMMVAKEKNGLYVSDESGKMALTDAIGSAAKLLGLCADVYYEKDRSKYGELSEEEDSSDACAEMAKCQTEEEVISCWQKYPQFSTDKNFRDTCIRVQKDITNKKVGE